jgi:FSR family fosmidomycin resistance protein-like MFS transporter
MLLPVLLGIAHGVSDAAAGLLVMRVIMLNIAPESAMLILLYNGLAFGLQPLAGLLLDWTNQPRRGAAIGLLLTAAGIVFAWVSLPLGIFLAGTGSMFLHSGGGSVAITSMPGKASAPGVFTAFGVVGLAAGSQLAFYFSAMTTAMLVVALLGLALIFWLWRTSMADQVESKRVVLPDYLKTIAWVIVVVLVIAVALRSLVWVGISSGFAGFSQITLILALAAGAGKLLGGFASDRFGWLRFTLVALSASILLLIMGGNWFGAVLAGVFFLQSVTPLSIATLGRLMPRMPGLAASLGLGTAIILGGVPFMLIPAGWFGIGIAVGALAISALLYWWAFHFNKDQIVISSIPA